MVSRARVAPPLAPHYVGMRKINKWIDYFCLHFSPFALEDI